MVTGWEVVVTLAPDFEGGMRVASGLLGVKGRGVGGERFVDSGRGDA